MQEEGRITQNPTKMIRSPRQGKKLPPVLTKDEAATLLDAPPRQTWLDSRNQAMLELLYSTGARVSELVGLNHEDIDLESGFVRLKGKGKKQRMVPLGTVAAEAIQAYHQHLAIHLAALQKRKTFVTGYLVFLIGSSAVQKQSRGTDHHSQRGTNAQRSNQRPFSKNGHASYPSTFVCDSPAG
jgi:site-specific recombinase XerD